MTLNITPFNNKNFFIRKNSTLPVLKYQLTQRILEKYDITSDMLENVAITFSMVNLKNDRYKIANTPARLIINRDRPNFPDEVEYTLAYNFKLRDTNQTGLFRGEFALDFLGDNFCGKIKLPVSGDLNIWIQDSITMTEVV
jgi:hypothetical protein